MAKNLIYCTTDACVERVEVRSLKSTKGFFVHKFQEQNSPYKYTVTHSASGYAVKHFSTLAGARLFCECAQRIDDFAPTVKIADDGKPVLQERPKRLLHDCWAKIYNGHDATSAVVVPEWLEETLDLMAKADDMGHCSQ